MNKVMGMNKIASYTDTDRGVRVDINKINEGVRGVRLGGYGLCT